MKPIFCALKRVRFLSDISPMESPAMSTSPEVISSSPERLFNSVVLPQPEGPHDGNHLAFTDSKVDALEGLDFDFAAVVGFADISGLDHVCPRRPLLFGGRSLEIEHVSSFPNLAAEVRYCLLRLVHLDQFLFSGVAKPVV